MTTQDDGYHPPKIIAIRFAIFAVCAGSVLASAQMMTQKPAPTLQAQATPAETIGEAPAAPALTAADASRIVALALLAQSNCPGVKLDNFRISQMIANSKLDVQKTFDRTTDFEAPLIAQFSTKRTLRGCPRSAAALPAEYRELTEDGDA
jgi:hypothetical protein